MSENQVIDRAAVGPVNGKCERCRRGDSGGGMHSLCGACREVFVLFMCGGKLEDEKRIRAHYRKVTRKLAREKAREAAVISISARGAA